MMNYQVPFNKPHLTGKETHYIYEAVYSGKISGNGHFTKKCQQFFQDQYGFKKCLLTTSCTDALEMCALLLHIQAGDEVIMPAYTFVSTSNAFVLRGAKIVFADSCSNHPNLDAEGLEALITPKTRAIVVVHYAGMACDMDAIMAIAEKYNLFVVEDAAQAIDSYYKGMPLGSIGHLAAFSFHETKNIIAGEGGMLVINDEQFIERSEIIWEKGTNRAAFFRGEINKYGWVDVGSSFLPSEIVAAFLYAQLEQLAAIQHKRKAIWDYYYEELHPLAEEGHFQLPSIPKDAGQNGHLFYLVFDSLKKRSTFIHDLKQQSIQSVFHYLSLHKSDFYAPKHDGRVLSNCERFANHLVRLPLFFDLTHVQQNKIVKAIQDWCGRF